MRILVMGGGIVGVTTAYQLVQDGHEVVLVERREGAGLETSWGNAGMIAPGHSFAWSSPQAPMILLKSLFAKNQALRFRPSADPRLWSWSLLFLRQCTEERARLNTLRKHRLCVYSQKMLHETLAANDLQYDRIGRGIYCPTDETGDCNKFAAAIAAACERRGAEFRYGTSVLGFKAAGDRIEA